MKYLCLVYHDERTVNSLAETELDTIVRESLALVEDLRQTGRYHAAEALQPVETATTLRVRHGRVSTTDGPFAETKEQLGGFYLIEAQDLNDALQLAARIPGGRIGSVEVRPVWDLDEYWTR